MSTTLIAAGGLGRLAREDGLLRGRVRSLRQARDRINRDLYPQEYARADRRYRRAQCDLEMHWAVQHQDYDGAPAA